MCVRVDCVHSPLHTYGDIHMNTHQQSGVCSNYGDIFESPPKSPLKSVFLGCKPYNWGHLRGPHKLVKNIHKLGPHKSVKFLILEKSVALLCNRLSNSPQTLTPPWF